MIGCKNPCQTCTGPLSTSCTGCIGSQFRALQNNECVCSSPHYQSSAADYPKCGKVDPLWCPDYEYLDSATNECLEICGDGRLYTLECDDGNTVDGDGCSSTCKIEPNYECRGGTNETKSACSYSGPLKFGLQKIIKDPNSNKLTLTLDIYPPIKNIQDLPNIKDLISTNIPNSGMIVSFVNGSLVI